MTYATLQKLTTAIRNRQKYSHDLAYKISTFFDQFQKPILVTLLGTSRKV